MTKQELDLKVAELQAKVEEQKHLAEAVEAKDKEIVELKTQLQLARIEAKEGNRAIVEQLRTQISALQKEVETKRPLADGAQNMKKDLDNAVLIANGYINNFRSFLKAQQGTLELAVELEALLSEKLPKKQ